MRISEKYERGGHFWFPENPDYKIPGTLKIFDGGKIELELKERIDEDIESRVKRCFAGENFNADRIFGQLEKEGPVTLENCVIYQNMNIGLGGVFCRSIIYVKKAFCGVIYKQNESIKFNSVKFSVEGLDEWLGISGINVDYSDDYKTATITYEPQQERVYELTNDFKLHIGFSYTLPSLPHMVEAKVTQKACLKISSINKERDFQDFIEKIDEIIYLLCFAIDAAVTISDVSATSNSLNYSDSVRIYYENESSPFSPVQPKINPMSMLFRFGDIKEDDVEIIFNNWFDVYVKTQPSIHLYVFAVSNKNSKDRFLNLARALETYHRGIYPKKVSFSQRIGKLIKPYKDKFGIGSNKERGKLICKIVDARDYFTHYDKKLEKKVVKGIDLCHIYQKMEAIFQLNLLQQLGFDKSKIEKILQNNYKLRQKTKSSIEN